MGPDISTWIPLWTAVAVAVIGVVGTVLSKSIRERADPAEARRADSELMLKRMERAEARTDELRKQMDDVWAELRELRRKNGWLSEVVEVLKAYVLTLEQIIMQGLGAPHQRPDHVQDIFDREDRPKG